MKEVGQGAEMHKWRWGFEEGGGRPQGGLTRCA